jgi:hypothetical protein
MDKETLVHIIKDWVKLDNEIRELQRQQLIRKIEKNKVNEKLIDIMRTNEIDCFDINDGRIRYSKKTVKRPITKKILITILTKYCEGNESKANELNDFIMNNRDDMTVEKIVRKIN